MVSDIHEDEFDKAEGAAEEGEAREHAVIVAQSTEMVEVPIEDVEEEGYVACPVQEALG